MTKSNQPNPYTLISQDNFLFSASRSVYFYFVLEAFPLLRYFFEQTLSYLIVFFFLAFFFQSRVVREFWELQKKENILLWMGIAITTVHLSCVFLFQHGPAYSWNYYRWLRALPFILFGITICIKYSYIITGLYVIAFANAVSCLISLSFSLKYQLQFGVVAGRALRNSAQMGETMALFVKSWGLSQSLVYIFILILSLIFCVENRNKIIYIYVLWLTSLIIISFTILTSGFLTTLICYLLALTMFLFLFVVKKENLILYIVLASITIVCLYFSFNFISSMNLPGFNHTFERLNSLWSTFTEFQSFDENAFSGDVSAETRFELNQVSLKSFYSSPWFGVGSHISDYKIIGGHSQVFDWLGQYGFLGSFGPLMIFYSCLHTALELLKSSFIQLRYWGKILCCFWIVFIINNFMGYAFLETTIDLYSFFTIGLTTGLRTINKIMIDDHFAKG